MISWHSQNYKKTIRLEFGEGNGNPLQYSYLGNPMDRGAWWATVHRVTRARHNLGTKPPPPRLKLKLGWHAGIWDSL